MLKLKQFPRGGPGLKERATFFHRRQKIRGLMKEMLLLDGMLLGRHDPSIRNRIIEGTD